MKTNPLLDRLPERLRARSRIRFGEEIELEEGPILYWMRNAARGHENPALNTLIRLANETGLAPFVMHTLTSVYPYASDRHHTFQLQGALDVDRELTRKNIPHTFYVERINDTKRHLREMVARSGLLIIEEIPVKPFSVWGKILGESTETPVVAVDTDCIVPMKWPDQYHNRAYKFRNATEDERERRIERDWRTPELDTPSVPSLDLPFEAIDPESMDLSQLIADCDIDHGIGPVAHSEGGSSSGYERWNTFRKQHLDRYHQKRNTPSNPLAVSRLSPYLHYGHVAPFRIAREASKNDSDGAQKFLDELITWRELAHHYCFYHKNYNCFSALPDWAQQTLLEHAEDRRNNTYDWMTLASAKTGDRLWDLCQESLLVHGELHNNLRMTWAKQLLQWTEDPRKALHTAIDLNNRYALDGRDPNSYGGIFWCYGLFDRAYNKERSVTGKLRPRTTDWHEQRVDMDSFSRFVHRPLTDEPFKVAVIGAGIAGSTATRILRNHGISVDCYEKSRGSGGRSSTRRITEKGTTYHFDHGAQYFTARSTAFRRQVKSLVDRGDVEQWSPDLVEINDDEMIQKTNQPDRYVAKPGMSSLTNYLLDEFEPNYSSRVESIDSAKDQLQLNVEETTSRYDSIILTAPPEQSADLVGSTSEKITTTCKNANFYPTWAVLLGFNESLPTKYDAAFVNTGPLTWIARNSSKPGRPETESWILHASPEWSEKHRQEPPEAIINHLLEEWKRISDHSNDVEPDYQSAHRWLYSQVDEPRSDRAVIDPDIGLILAGDWLAKSRIEGAFLSGRAAASRVLNDVLDFRHYAQEELFE